MGTPGSRQYVKMDDVKLGDVLIADGGFTCIHQGRECEVKQDPENCEFYVDCFGQDGPCDDGSNEVPTEKHYLSGQLDEHRCLVGFVRKEK